MSSMPYILHNAEVIKSYDLETSLKLLKNVLQTEGYLENKIKQMFVKIKVGLHSTNPRCEHLILIKQIKLKIFIS